MDIEDFVAATVGGKPIIQFPVAAVGSYVQDANHDTVLEIRAGDGGPEGEHLEDAFRERAVLAALTAKWLNGEAQRLGII